MYHCIKHLESTNSTTEFSFQFRLCNMSGDTAISVIVILIQLHMMAPCVMDWAQGKETNPVKIVITLEQFISLNIHCVNIQTKTWWALELHRIWICTKACCLNFIFWLYICHVYPFLNNNNIVIHYPTGSSTLDFSRVWPDVVTLVFVVGFPCR